MKRHSLADTACKVAVALCAVSYLTALVLLDPEKSKLFWKCPFYALTGLKCAGCGGQRALHWLLHGDFARAMDYNFFLVCIAPVYALAGCFKKLNSSSCYWIGWVVLLVGYMVARNLWPGTPFTGPR